jgi:phytanoyl-CoA hydroxylase
MVSFYVTEHVSLTDFDVGHTLGREIEADFTHKAKESGLSEEEAKNAFNQNMLSTGLLADGPKEYADTFEKKWLVTSYEAGDVVLHNPFAIHASTMNFDPDNVIRVGTDLRFVDASKPWDTRWDHDYQFNDGV